MPCRAARPERGRTCPSVPSGKREDEPGRHGRPCAGRDGDRRIGRDRRHEIEPGRLCALIRRQRQIGRMRQPDDGDGRAAHRAGPAERGCDPGDQLRAPPRPWTGSATTSTPAAVTRCTLLRSPPMTPLARDTSLATIQSQPLRWRASPGALSMTSSVSAAKPIDQPRTFAYCGGRRSPGCRDSRPAPAPAPCRRSS